VWIVIPFKVPILHCLHAPSLQLAKAHAFSPGQMPRFSADFVNDRFRTRRPQPQSILRLCWSSKNDLLA